MPQPSVLVVADEHNARVALSRFLQASGFLVFEASEAKGALRLLNTMRMAAVLLDGDHLPEPGSRELLGLLASLKPRTSLVYLTFQDASRVPPLAVPALVRKPCDPPRLLGVLRELCTAAA